MHSVAGQQILRDRACGVPVKPVSALADFFLYSQAGIMPTMMAPASSASCAAFKAASRMGRRPLDRRRFRDACADARSQMWLPENVPQDVHLRELVVGWLDYSLVEVLKVLAGHSFSRYCIPAFPWGFQRRYHCVFERFFHCYSHDVLAKAS